MRMIKTEDTNGDIGGDPVVGPETYITGTDDSDKVFEPNMITTDGRVKSESTGSADAAIVEACASIFRDITEASNGAPRSNVTFDEFGAWYNSTGSQTQRRSYNRIHTTFSNSGIGQRSFGKRFS